MTLSKLNPDGTVQETTVISGKYIVELDNGKRYFITEKNVHEMKIAITEPKPKNK